jgi:hypothetical protein
MIIEFTNEDSSPRNIDIDIDIDIDVDIDIECNPDLYTDGRYYDRSCGDFDDRTSFVVRGNNRAFRFIINFVHLFVMSRCFGI